MTWLVKKALSEQPSVDPSPEAGAGMDLVATVGVGDHLIANGGALVHVSTTVIVMVQVSATVAFEALPLSSLHFERCF